MTPAIIRYTDDMLAWMGGYAKCHKEAK